MRRLGLTLSIAAALAGCGSGETKRGPGIPAADVDALSQRLDEVQRRFDANNTGACNDIERDSFPAIDRSLQGLPSDTDPDIRATLENGLARLQKLTRQGCRSIEPVQTQTETVPPQHTVPEQPLTETTPQQTVPDRTTPQETTPQDTAPSQPGDQGNDGGLRAPGGGE